MSVSEFNKQFDFNLPEGEGDTLRTSSSPSSAIFL